MLSVHSFKQYYFGVYNLHDPILAGLKRIDKCLLSTISKISGVIMDIRHVCSFHSTNIDNIGFQDATTNGCHHVSRSHYSVWVTVISYSTVATLSSCSGKLQIKIKTNTKIIFLVSFLEDFHNNPFRNQDCEKSSTF